jgi:hypothetical protein
MKAALELLLILLAAAPPADSCAIERGRLQEMYGEPVEISGIDSLQAVPLRKDGVVAEAVQEVDLLRWETLDPVSLRFDGRKYSFPARSVVTRIRTSLGPFDCFWSDALAGRGPAAGRGLVTCLSDRDSDGRRETALLLDATRGDRAAALPLDGSTRLLAVKGSERDIVAHRRIRVDSVSDREAVLVLEHAATVGGRRGAFQPMAGGSLRVPLEPGEIRLGGIALRLAASAGRWTVTALDPRFPQWVTVGCAGTVTIGRTPAGAAPPPVP